MMKLCAAIQVNSNASTIKCASLKDSFVTVGITALMALTSRTNIAQQ